MLSPKKYRVKVMFTQSCKYRLPGLDWMDANKLFGVSWLGFKRRSFRIGWRWNPIEDCIELCAYRRIGDERFIDWFPLKLPVYQEIYIGMEFEADKVFVFVENKVARNYDFPVSWLMLRHNVFFGGNNSAPQDVSLVLHQIK